MLSIRHLLVLPLILSVLADAATRQVLENPAIGRVLSTEDGHLRTVEIDNHLANRTITPDPCPEFLLRISAGTDRPGPNTLLGTELQRRGNEIAYVKTR